jgi:hypothetical protein
VARPEFKSRLGISLGQALHGDLRVAVMAEEVDQHQVIGHQPGLLGRAAVGPASAAEPEKRTRGLR